MRPCRVLGLVVAAVVGVAPSVTGAAPPGAERGIEAFEPPPHTEHNGSGTRRIGIIADSVGTTIAFNNTFAPLRRFDYTYDAAGCRRTLAPSCKRLPPLSGVATMQRYRGQWGSLLVMLTGHNDGGSTFPEAVDAVMAEAARQGIATVMWLTMRTADVRCVPLNYRSSSITFRDNNLVLLQKSRQYGGRLIIADWATYSQRYGSNPNFVSPDGVHMYPPAGSLALSQYIADSATRVLAGEDITPTCAQAGAATNTPWTFLRFGMGGTAVADAQRALLALGINLPGGATGYYDILTVYAVATFQRSVGLPAKGHIDEPTARALRLIGAPWPIVAPGATGTATVRRIETALIDRGIAVRGGVDGVYDIWLTYAVMTFQRHNGLTVSGIVDIATAARLGLTRAPAPGSVWSAISNGSTGLLVSRAQQALVSRGINLPTGVTGRFDVATMYAVMTFQRYNGLAVTGVVDVETARKLALLDAADNPIAGWVDFGLGAAGPAVRTAEECLAAASVRVADGTDGIFKVGDYYAVRTFQRWLSGGLPVTGRVDLASADRLGMLLPGGCAATVMASLAMIEPPTTLAPPTTVTTSTTTTTPPTTATPPAPATTVVATSTTTTTPTSTTVATATTTETTLEPETALEPETIESESTLEPDTSLEPDATLEPEFTLEPDTTLAPDTTLETETTVAPETTATPDTTVGPETTLAPAAPPVDP